MFLVPLSSRAVDPYLQTLLLRVSLSRLGGKHRQLERQVGDSASSSANSMVRSSDANNLPKGTTLVFGSWSCMADGSGGFSSHLITPKASESKTNNQSAEISSTAKLGGDQAALELDLDIIENVSTPTRTHESAESDANSDPENFQFSEPSENMWLISSQLNALIRSSTLNYSME